MITFLTRLKQSITSLLQRLRKRVFFKGRHVRRGREGLYKVFSRTVAGRYILVVLAYLGRGNWRVVTARDMTDKERRLYISVTGGR